MALEDSCLHRYVDSIFDAALIHAVARHLSVQFEGFHSAHNQTLLIESVAILTLQVVFVFLLHAGFPSREQLALALVDLPLGNFAHKQMLLCLEFIKYLFLNELALDVFFVQPYAHLLFLLLDSVDAFLELLSILQLDDLYLLHDGFFEVSVRILHMAGEFGHFQVSHLLHHLLRITRKVTV